MSKLQYLRVFLTDRLTLAAQEIFKAVEDIVNEELCRSRQEIEMLRRKLQQAGLQLDSETQSCSYETRDTETFSGDQWRSEQDGKDTEVHMKLEVYTQQEGRVQMSVCNESILPCIDTDHDSETQMMDNSENGFPFINQTVHIKNEPGLQCEKVWQTQYFTTQSSDDPYASDTSSDHKIKIIHSPAHRTQACYLPLTNPEMMMQRKIELAHIRERMSICQDEVSTYDKRKAINARNAQAWRDRLKKDPVKYAEYKALEAARARQYRRKKTAADKEIDKKKNRDRQRRFRAKKKLQICKSDEFLTREERIKRESYDRIKTREEMDWRGVQMKRHICEGDASQETEERNVTEAN